MVGTMADEQNTVVSGNVTPPGESTVQQTTQVPGDSGAGKGLENRIYGLTAERDRLKEQVGDLQTKVNTMVDTQKTEQERAIDQGKKEAIEQYKKAEHEPVVTQANAMTARMDAQIAQMREGLPAEAIPPDFDDRDTLYQFDFLASLSSMRGTQPPPRVGTSVNPSGPQADRVVPGSEFRAWQSTNMYNPEQKAQYDAKRDEMLKAHSDGRVDWNK